MRQMDAHIVEEEKGQGCVGADQIHPDDEEISKLHPANRVRVRIRLVIRVEWNSHREASEDHSRGQEEPKPDGEASGRERDDSG